MNDKATLLSTALLTLFFILGGLFGLLDHFIVMMILFMGFLGIVINIIIVKSKKDEKKDLPPDSYPD